MKRLKLLLDEVRSTEYSEQELNDVKDVVNDIINRIDIKAKLKSESELVRQGIRESDLRLLVLELAFQMYFDKQNENRKAKEIKKILG